jgi:inner membrane protein
MLGSGDLCNRFLVGMDGFTHGVLGAATAHAVFGRRLGRWALLIGAGAGMLPDADYLIRSPSDPLLTLVTHRSFTHALLFIPLGGLIATLPFLLSRALRQRWKAVYLAATLAYATHGPLDAANPFGTLLFWPLSRERVSLDIIALWDPFFTLPLLAGVLWSLRARAVRPARIALAWAIAYLALGTVQHERASRVQARVIEARGHTAVDARAMPVFGSVLLYRSLYRDGDGIIYVDAIRVPLWGAPTLRPGTSVPAFQPDAALLARARSPARLVRDVARYAWVAQGYVGRIPDPPDAVTDLRYSPDPAGLSPLWGFVVAPEADAPVRPFTRFRAFLAVGQIAREIAGLDPRHRPAP